MGVAGRILLLNLLLFAGSISHAEEKVYMSKPRCSAFVKHGYATQCKYDSKEDDYYTTLTKSGLQFQKALDDAYDRGVKNGTIDPNADIIVTAPRFDPVTGLPYLEPDLDAELAAATAPLSVPQMRSGEVSDTSAEGDDIAIVQRRQEPAPVESNRPTAQDITSQYDTLCKPQLEETQKCCQHPEQCLGNGGAQNSAILGSLQAVLSSAGQAASLSGACGQMQNVALTTTAINTALASQCVSKIAQCKQSCSQVIEQARAMYTECRGSATLCTTQERAELSRISGAGNSCEANESFAQQQANQTIASALTAKTMGLCKDATTGSAVNTASNTADIRSLSINCLDSANAANPACQTRCNRAGSQNDPLCNQNSASGGFGSSNGGLVDPNSKSNGALKDSLDEVEANQTALTDSVAPTASKTAASSGGGGSGVGGGGDSPVDAPLRDYGSSLDSLSFDTKSVAGGVRTGSGYSAGGSRSPASSKEESSFFKFPFFGKKDDGPKSFNPKDYLPGGRLDPRRRLAGLGQPGGIGSAHGDIFKSITNRFYQVCLRDALMDCEILRKNGPVGK